MVPGVPGAQAFVPLKVVPGPAEVALKLFKALPTTTGVKLALSKNTVGPPGNQYAINRRSI